MRYKVSDKARRIMLQAAVKINYYDDAIVFFHSFLKPAQHSLSSPAGGVEEKVFLIENTNCCFSFSSPFKAENYRRLRKLCFVSEYCRLCRGRTPAKMEVEGNLF